MTDDEAAEEAIWTALFLATPADFWAAWAAAIQADRDAGRLLLLDCEAP